MTKIEISNVKLVGEIADYCAVNNIADVQSFAEKMLKKGFAVERYGMAPQITDAKTVRKEEEKVADTTQTEKRTEANAVVETVITEEVSVESEETVKKPARKTRKLK